MRRQTAELLAEESPTSAVNPNYCGRGMGQRTTNAVTFPDTGSLYRAIAIVAYDAGTTFQYASGHEDSRNARDREAEIKEQEKILRDLGELVSDSLGFGIVVY